MLRLRFEPDTDGTGELFAEVRSGHFAGASSAWFDAEKLACFARKLGNSLPLVATDPQFIEGGYWSKSGQTIKQLHIGLKFYPIGSTGKVGCRTTLATPILPDQDRPDAQSTVAVELHTTYERLRVFAAALESVVLGHADEALLHAEG
jgi:hypothetical protein